MRYIERKAVKAAIATARALEQEPEPLPGEELAKSYQQGLHIGKAIARLLGLPWFIREKPHRHACWRAAKAKRRKKFF